MTNLDNELDQQLRASAADLTVAPGDMDRVMARSHTRRRRQTVASVTAVLLVAGTIAGTAIAAHHSRPITVAAEGNNATLGAPALAAGDGGVVWQSVDPHSALGYPTAVTAGGDLYALSTAPGVTHPTTPDSFLPRQLYKSADGVNWSTAAGPADTFVSDLSASTSLLYAVGTGPATVATGGAPDLVVGSSANGGTTWTRESLPIDLAAIAAGTIGAPAENLQVTSNDSGVLVVAQVAGNLNVPKYLPAGVTAPNGWVITDTGVDLLGPIDTPACPAGMSTSPPGVSVPPTTVAPSPGPVEATDCWSDNGSSVTGVQGAGITPGAASAAAKANFQDKAPATVVPPESNHPVVQSFTWAQLGIGGDLEHAALGEPSVFFSTDGTTFHAVSLPDATALAGQYQQFQLAATSNGFAIGVNVTGTGPGVGQDLFWQSPDGTTWTEAPAAAANVAGLDAMGYLNGRLTVVSESANSDDGPSVDTLSGTTWTDAPLSPLVNPPSGTTVQTMTAGIGPFGIAVAVGIVPSSAADGGPQVSDRLLFSRDGATWSSLVPDQLVGHTVYSLSGAIVTANRFLVTAALPNTNPQQATPEAILVGTAG